MSRFTSLTSKVSPSSEPRSWSLSSYSSSSYDSCSLSNYSICFCKSFIFSLTSLFLSTTSSRSITIFSLKVLLSDEVFIDTIFCIASFRLSNFYKSTFSSMALEYSSMVTYWCIESLSSFSFISIS